jgi:hypothetical protein
MIRGQPVAWSASQFQENEKKKKRDRGRKGKKKQKEKESSMQSRLLLAFFFLCAFWHSKELMLHDLIIYSELFCWLAFHVQSKIIFSVTNTCDVIRQSQDGLSQGGL